MNRSIPVWLAIQVRCHVPSPLSTIGTRRHAALNRFGPEHTDAKAWVVKAWDATTGEELRPNLQGPADDLVVARFS